MFLIDKLENIEQNASEAKKNKKDDIKVDNNSTPLSKGLSEISLSTINEGIYTFKNIKV